jgi:hypothetical protein
MQSTVGIWEDDYDLLLDPARILEIDGHRVYTNLANLVTGSETLGLNSSGFFLVGGSCRCKTGLGMGGIFDRHAFDTPLFTGLYDPNSGDALFGSARVDSVEWQDLDTNGTYDFKRVSRTERNAWQNGADHDVYLGVGLGAGKLRFGVGAIWDRSQRANTAPGWDYMAHEYDSSLIAGRLTYLSDDTGHYLGATTSDEKSLVLSGRFEMMQDWVLAINLRPGLRSSSDAYGRTNWSRADYNPGSPVAPDYELSTLVDSSRLPYQGMNLPVEVQFVRTRQKDVETRVFLNGFSKWQTVGSDAETRTFSSFEQTLHPGFAAGSDTELHKYRGATSTKGLGAALLRRHWLGERFDVGWGCQVNLTMRADSLLDTTSSFEVTRYDNGDSIPNHADYVRTVTASESWLRREVGRTISAVIPVGLEFRVKPSIALRLGAVQDMTWDAAKTTNQLLTLSPSKTRTDYGDGAWSESWDPNPTNPTGSENRNTFSQTTTFTYGAGFRPVEPLQIDLMGFANLTDLTGWRLSATFRF